MQSTPSVMESSHLWLDGHSDLVHPFSSRTRKLSRSTLTVVLSCASRREKSSLSTTPFTPGCPAPAGPWSSLFPCILGRALGAPPLPFPAFGALNGGQPLLSPRQPARVVPPVPARGAG